MNDSLLLDRRDAAAIITLNRPAKLNALDEPLMHNLDRATREVAEGTGAFVAKRPPVFTGK